MYQNTIKQTELTRMKFVATALFGVVTVIYIVALIFEKRYLWVGFVSATAEAAMVGAIADWFAVTALFRHPLGLKIPHTAIIPKRKDAIAENFGRFVKSNFLSEQVISDKLYSMNMSKSVALWISQPENSKLIANQVAAGLAGMTQVMNDEDIQDIIEHSIQTQIRSLKIAPILGNLLSLITSGKRKQELFQGAVQFGVQVLEQNRDVIQERIALETPWWFPEPVDKAIHKKIVDAAENTLQEVNADPNHPLQKRFDTAIDRFLEDLKHSSEISAKEEIIKEELLEHPMVKDFASSLWVDIKISILEHSSNPDTAFRRALQQGIIRFGEAFAKDEVLLAKSDRWIEEGAIYLVKEYGYEVEQLISETVKKWDARAASDKIELEIGKDLQFIRINGTIVGGLAGFIIHALSFLSVG